MRQEIFSIGIDIGTSTTQMIFSRIILENMANAYSVPRISIVDKEVVYRSEIYLTPLLGAQEIDAAAVKRIVAAEYQKSGFTPEQISTGAVIITGETARKKNASQVLEALSSMAGDFVVATAGPDLESVLAAKGAGADVLSREQRSTLANVDIGGGTSNIAVYRSGNLLGTACLDIGGRLIKVQGGKVTYVYERLQGLLEERGIRIRAGDPADEGTLCRACGYMAEHLAQALNLTERTREHGRFYTNQGSPLPADIRIDGLTFSGGVADCIGSNEKNAYPYGDVGLLLGRAIHENPAFQSIRIWNARETIRATVVGAGTHTTSVSGSTISYSSSLLPLKNIPVLKVPDAAEGDAQAIGGEIAQRLPIFFTEGKAEQVAIALVGRGFESFRSMQTLAQAILEASRPIWQGGFPLVVILEIDIAKALGNMLRSTLGKETGVICIDGISVNDGDYVDIGEPLIEGSVVPVVTKTLIFNN